MLKDPSGGVVLLACILACGRGGLCKRVLETLYLHFLCRGGVASGGCKQVSLGGWQLLRCPPVVLERPSFLTKFVNLLHCVVLKLKRIQREFGIVEHHIEPMLGFSHKGLFSGGVPLMLGLPEAIRSISSNSNAPDHCFLLCKKRLLFTPHRGGGECMSPTGPERSLRLPRKKADTRRCVGFEVRTLDWLHNCEAFPKDDEPLSLCVRVRIQY